MDSGNNDGLYVLEKSINDEKEPKITFPVKIESFNLTSDGKVKVEFIPETDNKSYGFTRSFENQALAGGSLYPENPKRNIIYYSYPQHKIDKSEKEENY